MKKIRIIVSREYLSRVRKKSFLVTTLLLPLGMFFLFGIIIYFTSQNVSNRKIGVIDETGAYYSQMNKRDKSFTLTELTLDSTLSKKELAENTKNDIIVQLFSSNRKDIDSITTYSESSISLSSQDFISDELNKIFRRQVLQNAGIDKAEIDSMQRLSLKVNNQTFEQEETHTEIAAVLGYGMGFLMYMVIFIYGVGVMRGVMEEKTNRIAEVIVSSVTPFELMMGKIIGIAFVGLTQLALWIMLLTILNLGLLAFLPSISNGMIDGVANNPELMPAASMAVRNSDMATIMTMIGSQNWYLIIGCFIFYFLGGYLIYAALFAAVGSLVNEDSQDAQQLTLPVSLPIILGFVILASTANDPHNSLAVFGSLFPLTSPIVMLGRIPYNPPAWQIALSMISLVVGFILIVWMSAKIYRIGILLYGKKVGWKEIIKWLRRA